MFNRKPVELAVKLAEFIITKVDDKDLNGISAEFNKSSYSDAVKEFAMDEVLRCLVCDNNIASVKGVRHLIAKCGADLNKVMYLYAFHGHDGVVENFCQNANKNNRSIDMNYIAAGFDAANKLTYIVDGLIVKGQVEVNKMRLIQEKYSVSQFSLKTPTEQQDVTSALKLGSK